MDDKVREWRTDCSTTMATEFFVESESVRQVQLGSAKVVVQRNMFYR